MNNKSSAALCIFLFIAAIVYSMTQGAHDFKNTECIICHTSDEQSSARVGGSLTAKCMTCHTDLYENSYMHPVDISPENARVPPDFPLSSRGLLTCNTCHDVHSSQETPLGTESNYLRRFESGKAFCNICHTTSTQNNSGHQNVFRKAHQSSKPKEGGSRFEVDEMSRNCLSCHDGVFASSVNLNARQASGRSSSFVFALRDGEKHPIGMNYDNIQSSNPKAMLRPISLVDKKIRFFNNGNVGCGSCHDPYSALEKSLVIANKNSKLCFACHKGNGR